MVCSTGSVTLAPDGTRDVEVTVSGYLVAGAYLKRPHLRHLAAREDIEPFMESQSPGHAHLLRLDVAGEATPGVPRAMAAPDAVPPRRSAGGKLTGAHRTADCTGPHIGRVTYSSSASRVERKVRPWPEGPQGADGPPSRAAPDRVTTATRGLRDTVGRNDGANLARPPRSHANNGSPALGFFGLGSVPRAGAIVG